MLDTHAALWFLSGDRRLTESARDHLIDDANRVLLSAAVVWEVSIKRALGKLVVPDDWLDVMLGADIQPLPVSLEHAALVHTLPHHHRDPFDRMLVAQATLEDAAIVTGDSALRPYEVALLW